MRMLALLVAGLFAGAVMAAPVPKEKAKDEEAIVGKWDLATWQGRPATATTKSVVLFVFSEGGLYSSSGETRGKYQEKFKLDPNAKPKTIDFISGEHVTPGIYELDGDTLKLCYCITPTNPTRPKEFKVDDEAGLMLITLKRAKDEKKEEKKDK